jgi:Protein of unknown function (DUF1565)
MRFTPISPSRRPVRARLGVALALAAALVGCGDHNPTDPADVGDDPGASLGLGESASAPVEAAVTRLPRSFFVDPRIGSDANVGTKLKPFKTLARGLGIAISGDTFRLASGVYSTATNGEKFSTAATSVTVPAGVTLIGTPAEDFTTRLQGGAGDTYGLDLKGGATIRNLIVSGFPTAIRAMSGSQTLKGVILDKNILGLDLRGLAKATLTGNSLVFLTGLTVGGITTGANLSQQAQLTLVGGSFSGAGENCRTAARGVVLNDASRLAVSGQATLKDIAGNAVVLRGKSKATVTRAIIQREYSVIQCTPLPSVLMQDSTTFTLKSGRVGTIGGTDAIGIQTTSRGLITLDSAQVTDHSGTGIKALTTTPRLVVKPGSLIFHNKVGIDVLSSFANLTVTGAVVSSNQIGIRTPFMKLRGTKVAFNATGVVLTGVGVSSDLGLPGSPGKNTIQNNSVTGLAFDVFDNDSGGANASGNTWNPGIQDADESGHYPTGLVVFGSSKGTNYQLDSGQDISF